MLQSSAGGLTDIAAWRQLEVALRKSGGGAACPVGAGTVQVSMIDTALPGATMNAEYAVLTKLVQSMLRVFQIASQSGSVAGA
jgi:hypothetical protein